ncbi:hypothetical protein D9M69_641390 [compost metagenome]
MKSGETCGGTTCSRSKVFAWRVTLPSASLTSNHAVFAGPSTLTRFELNANRALYFSMYFISGGTKVGTPNSAAPARLNSTSMSFSTPLLVQ